jgi:hypothetical protein
LRSGGEFSEETLIDLSTSSSSPPSPLSINYQQQSTIEVSRKLETQPLVSNNNTNVNDNPLIISKKNLSPPKVKTLFLLLSFGGFI